MMFYLDDDVLRRDYSHLIIYSQMAIFFIMKKKYAEEITSRLIDELKRIRLDKNLSHEKLALLCGLDRSAISLIESKKRIPTILTCIKIAISLEISLAEILKDLEENSTKS